METSISNLRREVECAASHLTSFTLRSVSSGGVVFVVGNHITFILPVVLAALLVILLIAAGVVDVYSRRA